MRGAVIDAPPPPTIEGAGGGDSRWVELITARNDIDAHLLSGRLSEAGIETRSLKDRRSPGAWLYGGSDPWAPVMILVLRYDLEAARVVLAEISYSAPAAESRHRAPGRRDRLAVIWWVTAILLGAAVSALVLNQLAQSATYCQLPALCDEVTVP